ncbi:MAG: 2-dehydropantoate 2-reductase [candidate division WOR-3 bacterium]
MKFIVLGAGAVGSYLITKLAVAGHTVETVVSKRSNKRHIENEGIELFSKDKRFIVKVPCYVYEDLKDIESDYLIIATKSHEAMRILDEIPERRFSFSYIVTLQNGAEVHLKASKIFGEDHLILSVREGVYAFDVHKVRHIGDGSIPNIVTSLSASRESIDSFVDILSKSNIPAVASYDGKRVIYEKLIINSIINPVATLLRVKNGFLLRMLNTNGILNLLEEALKVVALEGIHINPIEIQDNLRKVLQSTSENRCSMLQDLEQKKKTEIEYINGYLLKLAKKHGMELRTHEIIYELILRLEEAYGTH